MNERWLAIFAAVVGVFLLVVGTVAVRGVDAAPVFYLIATEGIGLGAVAFVSAAGLLSGRSWARRTLVGGSILLAILSVTIIAIAPGTWDIQIIFLGFSGLLWWQLSLWRRRNASAP